MRTLLFHRHNKRNTIPAQHSDQRRPLYAPMHVPVRNVPCFLPNISGAVYPSELQCRNGIASALRSTYTSILNAFAPDNERNLAFHAAEHYSICIQKYIACIRLPLDLYFEPLGKTKDYARINALAKNSRQDLLLRFQQLLIKRADLYKLHPLDEYVDLALFCETADSEDSAADSESLCLPRPLRYKIVSVTEPWNRLQQTKKRMFEAFAAEAYQIYKDYMFEIECLLSSSAAPAPESADDKDVKEFHDALAKYVKKHKKYKIAV